MDRSRGVVTVFVVADGHSSVLIRTRTVVGAFDHVRDWLGLRSLDEPDRLLYLQSVDRNVSPDALKRELDP